ncbi:coiled-coil domain-containing protein [Aureliella helgolandensis]|uniref:DUF4175 family protein n=1 Tax=Aureliella helgolandensis TaxID=2527968 RepID=A0A518GC83_9BACT|nr:hypothetical protein [Aureliella helgolandensis]QDV26157.1 hypothetical protein Q31a_45290 [Aureliella helgolandensis]
MDTRLKQRLIEVARRMQSVRRGWCLTAIFLMSAAIAWGIYQVAAAGFAVPAETRWWWLGCTIVAALLAAVLTRPRERQYPQVVQRLERTFPSLNQRLVTATGLRSRTRNGEFGYLERSVISEALQHDRQHVWRTIIPNGRLLVVHATTLIALAAMVLIAVRLWQPEKQLSLQPASIKSVVVPQRTPIITPGNTEVERGSSLIVTARFESDLPDEVWLLQRVKGDAEADVSRISMRRSLNDPVFAAFLYDVREPLEYAVEFDQRRTPDYQVDVFDYPALVRADAVLEYPVYTQQETKTVVDTRRVTAAAGTKLTWQLHLNKPAITAHLLTESGDTHAFAPTASDATVLETTLQLNESIQWTLQLVDRDGRQQAREITLRAKVLPNKPSVIQLTSGGDAVVSPIEEFLVAAKITDDFAVFRSGIGYQFGDSAPVEIEQARTEADEVESAEIKPSRELTLSEMIDFESLNAEPNQFLSYYAWAEDRDVDGQVRRTMSDMYFVEVRPFEEIFRQGEQPSAGEQQQSESESQPQGNEETEELLELQKQIMIATWNVMREAKGERLLGRSAPDLVMLAESQASAIELLEEKGAESNVQGAAEILARATEKMQAAVKVLELSADSLSKTDLSSALASEQAAYQELLRLQSREHEVVRSQQSRSSQSRSQRSQARQQQINELELENQENRYENERLAQDQQSEEQNTVRQVLSRLRELAARQEDINEQLREIEAALQAADSTAERETLEQQLQRLREQQQQMLQDSDELQENLDAQNSPSLEEAQEQMQEIREDMQQASQSLQQGNTSQALSSGTRAAQNLDEMQEEVRQQAAGQFAETMQEMKGRAAELEETQDQIVEQMDRVDAEPSGGLRAPSQESDVAEQLEQQRQRLNELLEQMQTTVEQAEDAEPLLAQRLYDSFRRTEQQQADQRLELTQRLFDRNLAPQARELAGQSVEDLSMLREDIEDASEVVLGNSVDSLRLALDQLERLENDVHRELEEGLGRDDSAERGQTTPRTPQGAADEEEISGDVPGGSPSPVDPSQFDATEGQTPGSAQNSGEGQSAPPQSAPGQEPSQPGQPQQSQPGQEQPSQGQPGQEQPGQGQSGQGQPGQGQPGQGQPGQEQPSQGQPGQGQPGQGQPGLRGGSPNNSGGRTGQPGSGLLGGGASSGENSGQEEWNPNAAPFTGEGFREWSDRLRDVEELVDDPQLRWEATQIRQAARELRGELKRHSAAPQWDELEKMVAQPLADLTHKVSQELMRRVAQKSEIVPIDRDPVPSEFSRSVELYYENLGRSQ